MRHAFLVLGLFFGCTLERSSTDPAVEAADAAVEAADAAVDVADAAVDVADAGVSDAAVEVVDASVDVPDAAFPSDRSPFVGWVVLDNIETSSGSLNSFEAEFRPRGAEARIGDCVVRGYPDDLPSLSAGPLTITGHETNGGIFALPAELPQPQHHPGYGGGSARPRPLWDAGTLLTASAPGADAPAFTLSVRGPASSGGELGLCPACELAPGLPLTVTFAPGTAEVFLELREYYRAAYLRQELACRWPAGTVSATVPQALLRRFPSRPDNIVIASFGATAVTIVTQGDYELSWEARWSREKRYLSLALDAGVRCAAPREPCLEAADCCSAATCRDGACQP